jgi:hypothetical protein
MGCEGEGGAGSRSADVHDPLVADVPDQVLGWVRSVFASCNARTTQQLSMSPNAPEESFDLTWGGARVSGRIEVALRPPAAGARV